MPCTLAMGAVFITTFVMPLAFDKAPGLTLIAPAVELPPIVLFWLVAVVFCSEAAVKIVLFELSASPPRTTDNSFTETELPNESPA